MHTMRGNGPLVRLIRAVNREAQYRYLFAVARDCKEETAVLYRNNDSALPLIDMLERGGIPYNSKKSDEVFFSNRIVNDVADIINFAYDQRNTDIFMRIYYKFDIQLSKKATEYACEQSRKSGKPILEELLHCPDLARYAKDAVIDLIEAFPEILKDDAVTALNRIWRGMRYGNFVRSRNLDEGKLTILKMLGQNELGPRRLLDRLGELQSIIRGHDNKPENKLLLSTVHSSKGLEYSRVYLLDVIDGILPQKKPSDLETDDEIKLYEEDRRVYYVAMTRAKNELNLFGCAGLDSCFTGEVLASMPQEEIDEDDVFAAFKRNMCGKKYTDKALGQGRIIAQCGETVLVDYDRHSAQLLTIAQMLENRDTTITYTASNAKAKAKPSSLTTPKARFNTLNIKEGTRIEHKSFGSGTVTAINDDIAEVYFHRNKQTKRIKLSLCISAGLLK
jgi:DNA helicase-2/ATP-dependent DNA helicase PcrA